MTIEDKVLDLIVAGQSPNQVQAALAIRRDQYYTALSALEGRGILSPFGALPDGATTEVCPSSETIAFLTDSIITTSWYTRPLATIRASWVRHGWMVPESDDRYTRSTWTGQAVRRVDFEHDGLTYTVMGFLVPRTDMSTWERATPTWRLISIEMPGKDAPTVFPVIRGRVVSTDLIDNESALDHILFNRFLIPATLAVAWVAEGRAALVFNSTTNRSEQ